MNLTREFDSMGNFFLHYCPDENDEGKIVKIGGQELMISDVSVLPQQPQTTIVYFDNGDCFSCVYNYELKVIKL